jgi:hypothetical protein
VPLPSLLSALVQIPSIFYGKGCRKVDGLTPQLCRADPPALRIRTADRPLVQDGLCLLDQRARPADLDTPSSSPILLSDLPFTLRAHASVCQWLALPPRRPPFSFLCWLGAFRVAPPVRLCAGGSNLDGMRMPTCPRIRRNTRPPLGHAGAMKCHVVGG